MTPPLPLFRDILLPGHPVIELPIADIVNTDPVAHATRLSVIPGLNFHINCY